MISLGKNITASGDILQQITLDQLYGLISNPNKQFIDLINQLRIVLKIDSERYKVLKRKLPYFVCSKFLPCTRLTVNFVSIEYFVLDIDHISQKNKNIQQIKNDICDDKRIVLAFESPSGDGLKLLFKLSKPLFDTVKYKMFYKVFTAKFSNKYYLNQIIDLRTNDATRATFLSFDAQAYYNPNAELIIVDEWINYENELEMHHIEKEIKEDIKKNKIETSIDATDDKVELTKSVLAELRQKLNPRLQKKEEIKTWFVPQEVEKLISRISETITNSGLIIKEITAIHYGRKIVFESGFLWAELNIFYGKKGYSVVKTPKRGTNAELAEICYNIIKGIIKHNIR